MGYSVCNHIQKAGGIITHIVELDTAIFKEDGIDIEDAKAFFVLNGTLRGY